MKQFIVLLTTLFLLVSCQEHYSGKAGSNELVKTSDFERDMYDTIPSQPRNFIQVMYSDGEIENIEDKKGIRPKVFDTLIICDFAQVTKRDTTLYKSIYGKYRGIIKKDFLSDSLQINYYLVQVIKSY